MPIETIYQTASLPCCDLVGILTAETQLCGIINNNPLRRRPVPYYPLDLYADNNRRLRCYIRDGDLNIIDLTGATCIFTVKMSKSDAGPTIQKSTSPPVWQASTEYLLNQEIQDTALSYYYRVTDAPDGGTSGLVEPTWGADTVVDGDLTWTKTAIAGQIGSADQGECFFYIYPDDTNALDIAQYVYDVTVILADGNQYTTVEGVLNLMQPVA